MTGSDSKPAHWLEGRTAIVTGGAVRVGAAISRAVVAAGAHLALHHHSHRDVAEELAEELRASGGQVALVQADLRRPEAARQIFDAVEEQLGPVTALVNNAAIIADTPLVSLEEEPMGTLLSLNLVAPLRLISELARRGPEEAAIVNIVDAGAARGRVGRAVYSASKVGLHSVTRSAAVELAPGIRVNAVDPGVVALRPEEVPRKKAIEASIPLGRIGSPEAIAKAVVFLFDSTYVNGAVIPVDGGRALVD